MLELKNYSSILRKNDSFANTTCCSLAALFVKMKTYFCCCNFTNKQKFLVLFYHICCSQQVEPKIFQKMSAVPELDPYIDGHLL